MKKTKYDTNKYNFRKFVESFLEFENLEGIHEEYKFDKILEFGTDQNRYLHKKFYKGMDNSSDFISIYRSFVKEYVNNMFEEKMIFQKFPTFRVHQPNNIAVFAFHKDKEYNHNSKEVNFYLPITKAFGTNTFWHESEEDKGDFRPMEAEYGELVMWDGANLSHGNKINETNQTRISFDFRVLPKKIYLNSEHKSSKSKGKSFVIGDYYDEF